MIERESIQRYVILRQREMVMVSGKVLGKFVVEHIVLLVTVLRSAGETPAVPKAGVGSQPSI